MNEIEKALTAAFWGMQPGCQADVMAKKLAENPLFKRLLADVWYEGAEAGMDYVSALERAAYVPEVPVNPYRVESTNG